MSLRLKFFAVLASASLGLVVAAVAYVAISSLREAQWWVSHTYEVIDALHVQEAGILDAESAQRGYLLGKDPADLARYDAARAAAPANARRIAELTADNPAQQERIVRLRDAADHRLQVLDDVLHGRTALHAKGDGPAAMASMRLVAAEMENAERALLEVRGGGAAARGAVAKVVLLVGSLIAFVLSIVTMRDLKREVDARERARLVTERQAEQLVEQALVLEASRTAAETANRTKSMFLANMSHELRTPLNAVLGYSEMLQEEAEDRGIEGFIPDLKSIHAAGKHLLGLINDVLDLSKIEAGKMDLFLEEFEMGAMLTEVERTIHPLVADKGNTLVIERGPPILMRADLTKVRQTLFNVLSNAAKFTEKGTIRVRVSTAVREGGEQAILRVTDSGIGMSQEQLGRLFEPFVQADASTTRKFGGTGLGLAISRRFCHMMGGDITAESIPGEGSTFTITLPTTVVVAQPSNAPVATSLAPLGTRPRVLVIDDDGDTRDLMRRHLTKEGFEVVTATNGADGLRLAREVRPVAITLDVMMPTTDGWSVLTSLKADPELREIPVIMLTMVSDRGLGFRLGAAEFMTKPIDRARLSEVLARFRPDSQDRSALLVEDDRETRRMTRSMLEKEGWRVQEAENGVEALASLETARPDVILLDLMMPDMDGFELASTLHAHDYWKTIPIVVLTAKDITEHDRLRLSGYVEKIIQKGSYDRVQLLNEVREIVTRHAQTRSAPRAVRVVSTPMIKILLVEDNEKNWDMLSRRLRRRGYEVILAFDGEQGVTMALRDAPNLILMDMSLPVIDGWEATRRIKSDAAGARIPIIALTAHAMSGDREKAKQAGCDDYHAKPVELADLLTQMEAALAKFPTP